MGRRMNHAAPYRDRDPGERFNTWLDAVDSPTAYREMTDFEFENALLEIDEQAGWKMLRDIISAVCRKEARNEEMEKTTGIVGFHDSSIARDRTRIALLLERFGRSAD